jgi:Xaa-Pro aminopeptidase
MLVQHFGDGFIQDLPRDIALVFIEAKRAVAVENMIPVIHKMKNKIDDKTISDMSNEIQSYFVVDSPIEVDAIRTEVAIIKAAVERLKQSEFVDKDCAELAFEIWATVEDLIQDSSVDNMITQEEEDIIKSDD